MMSNRAEHIRDNYALAFDGQWIATSRLHGAVVEEIRGADRADVCRKARCRWGHFNFEDEARAFDEIFRGYGGQAGQKKRSNFYG